MTWGKFKKVFHTSSCANCDNFEIDSVSDGTYYGHEVEICCGRGEPASWDKNLNPESNAIAPPDQMRCPNWEKKR